MQNQLTRLLGIEHPIIQGGMREISRAALAAAVSNAGGLGTLGVRSNLEAWTQDLRQLKALTSRPFAVNLPLHLPDIDERLRIISAEGVKIVVTAAGNPTRLLGALKDAGVTVMHVVASVDQARKVEAAGVDAIVAEGGESGGMVAKDRVNTMVLVPAVVDAVKVPVVAAGGIADARGLIAALALGASGVQMGTRFVAALECETSAAHKDAILKAKDTDTRVLPRGSAQGRLIKEEMAQGAMAGEVVALINDIEPAAAIIKRMMAEAETVRKKIEEQF